MLGHDQPRDPHVHGAPHDRGRHHDSECSIDAGSPSSTATKYRNTTGALYYRAGLIAPRPCSATKMGADAGSSG